MKNAANVLSTFRLIGSIVASVFILLGPEWSKAALVLIALASVTEPLDGEVARWLESRNNLAKPWFAATGKGLNELATAALTILVPGAVLLRLIVATCMGWHMGYGSLIVDWVLMCVLFVVMTGFFALCRAQLVPKRAENAEVWQAWFTWFIVVSCAYAVYGISSPVSTEHYLSVSQGLIVAVVVVTAVVCLLAFVGTNRLTKREAERPSYKGNRASLFGKPVR